jgi:hypothetical protein
LITLCALLVTSCHEGPTSSTLESPLFEIQDAVHNDGNPYFFFLPPLVPNPPYNGTFDATLSPEVHICHWDGICGATVALFDMTTGPGSETVRLEDEHYIVNWHTDEFDLVPAQTYRIQVFAEGIMLGYADVQILDTMKDAKNLKSGETFGLLDGRTMPIKFRIEEGALVPFFSIHGVYKGAGIRDVVYAARSTTGIWTSEIAANNNDVGAAMAIATAPDGSVHIVYRATLGHVHYVTNQSGTWTTEPVYTAQQQPSDAPVAICTDANGSPFVAFKGPGIREVRLASTSGGAWISEIAANNNDVGGKIAVAAADDGTLHIAYRVTLGHIHYVTGTSGSWYTEPLDLRTHMRAAGALAIALRSGSPVAAFHGSGIRDVIYSRRESGSWIPDVAAHNNDVGDYLALLVSDAEPVTIVYQVTLRALHHVWGEPQAWSFDLLDWTPEAALPQAIALAKN